MIHKDIILPPKPSAPYLIMDELELRELWREVNLTNYGSIALHLEFLVRLHPKFSQWATTPKLASMCMRMKDPVAYLKSEIQVILFTLKRRPSYRI